MHAALQTDDEEEEEEADVLVGAGRCLHSALYLSSSQTGVLASVRESKSYRRAWWRSPESGSGQSSIPITSSVASEILLAILFVGCELAPPTSLLLFDMVACVFNNARHKQYAPSNSPKLIAANNNSRRISDSRVCIADAATDGGSRSELE